jgi:hypothetical protein
LRLLLATLKSVFSALSALLRPELSPLRLSAVLLFSASLSSEPWEALPLAESLGHEGLPLLVSLLASLSFFSSQAPGGGAAPRLSLGLRSASLRRLACRV